ncbi:hypothetical protein SLEP1_g6482 [Rubroshorea leprosula]|uniref:Uncharacterized protein n=1 Tax=Rubroshorea leprosula TaxID=152421 RepID=A0AAV5I3K5_9ROSI|nr:hypothetical protein SLEP1_g6482 [Rubroshorea leprosula]
MEGTIFACHLNTDLSFKRRFDLITSSSLSSKLRSINNRGNFFVRHGAQLFLSAQIHPKIGLEKPEEDPLHLRKAMPVHLGIQCSSSLQF